METPPYGRRAQTNPALGAVRFFPLHRYPKQQPQRNAAHCGDRLVVQNGGPDYGRFGRYVDRGRVYPPGFGDVLFGVLGSHDL